MQPESLLAVLKNRYFRSCSCVFSGVSHSKTKTQPETVSVDSLVFVKLIVWSESSNTTQSIVATCHNELKKEN